MTPQRLGNTDVEDKSLICPLVKSFDLPEPTLVWRTAFFKLFSKKSNTRSYSALKDKQIQIPSGHHPSPDWHGGAVGAGGGGGEGAADGDLLNHGRTRCGTISTTKNKTISCLESNTQRPRLEDTLHRIQIKTSWRFPAETLGFLCLSDLMEIKLTHLLVFFCLCDSVWLLSTALKPVFTCPARRPMTKKSWIPIGFILFDVK